ncbi:MAG: MerR family transcriptional regulator [Desulfobacterales bacterium]|nr:MerR family transcriptional regulator [Desulfobacterales bacterium]
MRIGELAKATATQVETIRFYEREGLLSEGARTDANYRLYAEAHVDRLAFIRQCRLLDMPLEEIRTLLRFKDNPRKSAEAGKLLTECLVCAAGRIQELKRLQAELKELHAQSARVRDGTRRPPKGP